MEVSRERLVRIFGITPRAVNDLEARAIIPKIYHGTYDLDLCVMGYVSHLREIAAGRGGEEAGKSLATERARLAKEQADAHELKNAKLRGDLLSAEDVGREWTAILQRVRAAILAVPARAQQRLAHLTAHDVSELDHEIRAALAEVGHDGNDAC